MTEIDSLGARFRRLEAEVLNGHNSGAATYAIQAGYRELVQGLLSRHGCKTLVELDAHITELTQRLVECQAREALAKYLQADRD